jgi:HD-GYP domain-containing protein (c-di-GMP phosphodiesterase class II)
MRHNDNVYGWLGLVSFNLKEIFRRSELRLLSSMAEQLAVVMANTDLYQDLERFVINVVKSLVYAIEAKDVYTRGHSERVNRYTMLMAEHLQLDEEQKKVLYWASILHDVGKIGIPEAILNKPGPLNDDEYRVIKSHPEKGYDILQPLEQLASSLPGILHHHERYDGGGYPHGVKGEEIPLLARIIAVADTFDAITSDRAYRKGKTAKEALTIIEKVAGTQLDPHLVEVFVDVLNEDLGLVQKGMEVLAA